MTDKEYAVHRKAVEATDRFLAKRAAFRKTAAYRLRKTAAGWITDRRVDRA